MKLDIYQVDAFAEKVFEGNPAAICPLDTWLDDDILQKIAEENNLSETAFFVPEDKGFKLRWFTPVEEVDLCGHATLAAAHVLYNHLGYSDAEISFSTKSGELIVQKTVQGLSMDFPASILEVVKSPSCLVEGLGIKPTEILADFDYVVVLESEGQVRDLKPDLLQWLKLDRRGVVVTAPGDDVDFVSRCFFPKLSINEDPVTGSAHCEMAPYWAARLGRKNLKAKQISKRTGLVGCNVAGHRVVLTGYAVDYMQGKIFINSTKGTIK